MPKHLYHVGKNWYGRVQVAGVEHRRSLRTSSRAEANRRKKKWREELIAEAHFGEPSHTWEEAVVAFLNNDTEALKSSTIERYKCSLRALDPILGGLPVAQISRQHLTRIAARKGVVNATRKRDLDAVMDVLYGAEKRGWIATAPDPRPVRRKERRDPIALPPDDDAELLINSCPGNLKPLVGILLLTGLRLEEAVGLQHRQVDLSRRVITLYKSQTNRPRADPLSAPAVGTLTGTPSYLHSPWVFWHDQGERYRNASSQLAAIRRRLGLRWRTHDLRHLFAVRYLRGGGSIYDLQQILGHSSIKTTEIYLDYLTPDEQRVAKRLTAR